ncbi:hypothetical protein ACFXTH_028499 [Malus domestica]
MVTAPFPHLTLLDKAMVVVDIGALLIKTVKPTGILLDLTPVHRPTLAYLFFLHRRCHLSHRHLNMMATVNFAKNMVTKPASVPPEATLPI